MSTGPARATPATPGLIARSWNALKSVTATDTAPTVLATVVKDGLEKTAPSLPALITAIITVSALMVSVIAVQGSLEKIARSGLVLRDALDMVCVPTTLVSVVMDGRDSTAR